MTETNQGVDAGGSIVIAASSQEGPDNREPKAERQGFAGAHRDRRTPTSEQASDRLRAGTRRRFLAIVGAVSTATLAGCSGSSDSTNGTEASPSEEPQSTSQPVEGVRLPVASLKEFQLGVIGFEQVTLPDEGGDEGGS